MSEPSSTTSKPEKAAPAPFASAIRFVLGTAILGVAIFLGLHFLAKNWEFESTDDAFIDGHVVAVASKVAGEILESHVVENQAVKAGDLLLEVDPRDFEVRVSQKRAALQSAEANQRAIKSGFALLTARIDTAKATKKQSEAEAEAAKATYDNANANWQRAQNMWQNKSAKLISKQEYDEAKANMISAKAKWQADQEKVISDASKITEAQAQLDTTKSLYEQAGAQISQSQSDLKAAELELSYTKIAAPVDGHIARKRSEQGAYIQVGQSLLAIVRPDIWVTANFKETQTAHLHAGQPVDIKIDGLTNRTLHGHVDSILSGSGARFSLLPPENAVGNFVKVVQRVPVKIVFDDQLQATEGLGPGMSVTPEVIIGSPLASDQVLGLISFVTAVLLSALFWILNRRPAKAPVQP